MNIQFAVQILLLILTALGAVTYLLTDERKFIWLLLAVFAHVLIALTPLAGIDIVACMIVWALPWSGDVKPFVILPVTGIFFVYNFVNGIS